MAFSVEEFRENFPILHKPSSRGKPIVYLDNAATTQKPQCVIDAVTDFYTNCNSNIHRGLYELAETATLKYENTRKKAAKYLNVDTDEIIFVRGTTEAINLVANCYVRKFLNADDEIIVGAAEHHSNYLPWQILGKEIGIKRKIAPLTETGEIDIDVFFKLFTKKTKFVAIQHSSNVLGNTNNISELTKIAHENGAKILIDGASSLLHSTVDLKKIDCDFFACSGHKCYAPMGVGILFGKYDLLESMCPYQVGGNTVNKVNFESSIFKLPPQKFEAGTQDIASVIGLGAAIDFLESVDRDEMDNYFNELCKYTFDRLSNLPFVKMYSKPKKMSGVFSFNIEGIHSHDVATLLGINNIAIRAGTHCAQPLMQLLGVPGTARASLAQYNKFEEIDIMIDSLIKCKKAFR